MHEVVRVAFCCVVRLFYKTNYATESHGNDFVNAKSHAREKALQGVCARVCILPTNLRGRRLKGKGKGVLCERETRGVREDTQAICPQAGPSL